MSGGRAQHPPAWNLLLYGSKRWYSYAPQRLPPRMPVPLKYFRRFGVNMTEQSLMDWVRNDLPELDKHEVRCAQPDTQNQHASL